MNNIYFGLTVNEKLLQHHHRNQPNQSVKNISVGKQRAGYKLMLLGMIFIVFLMFAYWFVQQYSFIQYGESVASAKPNYITVQQGDTLWNIAKQHSPKHLHFTDYMKKIKRANDLSGWTIVVGHELVLP